MKQYIVRNRKTGGEMLFKFDMQGRLIAFDLLETEPTQKLYTFIQTKLPVSLGQLQQSVKNWKESELHEIALDLSFLNFWNTYNYKHGRKKECEKSWKKLSDEEKGLVLVSIAKYNKFLKHNPREKMYPATYLNQNAWENYL